MDFGTYMAHPISLAAAKATLAVLETGRPYEQMTSVSESVQKGITSAIDEFHLDAHVAGFRSIFVVYFTRREIKNYADLAYVNTEAGKRYKIGLMSKGILTLPLPIKRMHVSAAHSSADADRMIEASRQVLAGLKAEKIAVRAGS